MTRRSLVTADMVAEMTADLAELVREMRDAQAALDIARDSLDQKLFEYYEAGHTMGSLGRVLGTSTQALQQRLQRHAYRQARL